RCAAYATGQVAPPPIHLPPFDALLGAAKVVVSVTGGNGIVLFTVGVDATDPGTDANPKFAAIVILSMLAFRPGGAALRGVDDVVATESDRYASKFRQSTRTVSRPRRSAMRNFFIAE
ncbi:hypothetical protein AAVH_43046, partial [Aphelenchoides avenae]